MLEAGRHKRPCGSLGHRRRHLASDPVLRVRYSRTGTAWTSRPGESYSRRTQTRTGLRTVETGQTRHNRRRNCDPPGRCDGAEHQGEKGDTNLISLLNWNISKLFYNKNRYVMRLIFFFLFSLVLFRTKFPLPFQRVRAMLLIFLFSNRLQSSATHSTVSKWFPSQLTVIWYEFIFTFHIPLKLHYIIMIHK